MVELIGAILDQVIVKTEPINGTTGIMSPHPTLTIFPIPL